MPQPHLVVALKVSIHDINQILTDLVLGRAGWEASDVLVSAATRSHHCDLHGPDESQGSQESTPITRPCPAPGD